MLLSVLRAGAAVVAETLWDNYPLGSHNVTVFDIFRHGGDGPAWLGTNGGLFSFDGYKAHHIYGKGGGFFGQIYSIVEIDGRLWLGSNNGLYIYDPAEGDITPVKGAEVAEIRAMINVDGRLWIGSLEGLYFYDTAAGTLSGPAAGLPHRAVYSLLSYGPDVYVGTYDGLCRYDAATRRFVTVGELRADKGNCFVNAIAADGDTGCLLLGMEGGLTRYFPATGAVEPVPLMRGSNVKAIAFTRRGRYVLGTDNGLYLYTPATDTAGPSVMIWRHDSRNDRSPANNAIWSVSVDNHDNILAGTDMGLSVASLDPSVHIVPLSELTGRTEGQQIYASLRDSRGNLWLGGSNGLIRAGADGRSDWFFPGEGPRALSHNRVRDIYESPDGLIAVATDGGLNVYDPATGTIVVKHIKAPDSDANANWVYSAGPGIKPGRLWTGAFLGGIFETDRDILRGPSATITADTVIGTAAGLPNTLINKIVTDGDGNKWVLLYRDGKVARIDAATGRMTLIDIHKATGHYPGFITVDNGGDIRLGLGTAVVKMDRDGRIGRPVHFPTAAPDEGIMAMGTVGTDVWLSTTHGRIWAVDTRTDHVRLIPAPSRTYTDIYYDPRTGNALLGGIDELIEIDPVTIGNRYGADSLRIVRLRGADRDFASSVRSLKLPYDANSLTVEVSTYNFTPDRARCVAYSLDGDDWSILPDDDNDINLTGLPEGRHTLRIKLFDSSEEPLTLRIDVTPPWYRSHAAIAAYIILLAIAAFTATRLIRRRQRRRIEQIERESALEKVGARLDFLTDISHDLKTPLSMVIGPLSRLRDDHGAAMDPQTRRSVETAYQNALKLNNLVHRSVEMNRVDAQTEAMMIISQVDAVQFCRTIFDSYAASYPGRTFTFTCRPDRIPVNVDAVKFESVLNNLLSNAVKYSGEQARLDMDVSSDGRSLTVRLTDDGIGIPRDEQSRIFQRMFRSPSATSVAEGTGIGLYLVKRYVEMHHGTISVDSEPGRGTTFTITLPLNAAEQPATESAPAPAAPETEKDTDPRPRVLIVDDNAAISGFISDLLSDSYHCLTAPDGKAGLDSAATFRPDLIIADEMMPVMSGLDMVRALKKGGAPLDTVPVIMLTAKTDNDLESRSIRSGIDVFMSKPFDAPLLKARVAQLLKSRADQMRAARIEHITRPKAIAAESDSEKLLAKVTEIIENNIADPELNVNFVCEHAGLQSKQLYRLLKKYVGQTPVDYIRQMRLRKAAMLLRQDRFTVSEVMYMVGFSSASYFSKCFTAQFGVKPGQYRKE